jgi:hypothetical protein
VLVSKSVEVSTSSSHLLQKIILLLHNWMTSPLKSLLLPSAPTAPPQMASFVLITTGATPQSSQLDLQDRLHQLRSTLQLQLTQILQFKKLLDHLQGVGLYPLPLQTAAAATPKDVRISQIGLKSLTQEPD